MDKKFGKFSVGPGHIFNPVPENEEEALQHGNALAASGNYPVGTIECFNVGISGGCGVDCFVYQKGECGEPGEIEKAFEQERREEQGREVLEGQNDTDIGG